MPVPIKSVTYPRSAVGSYTPSIPTNDVDPRSKSIEVVYGVGLNSEFLTSILFFTIVFLSCDFVSEKSSTKNPHLNLFRPFASLI